MGLGDDSDLLQLLALLADREGLRAVDRPGAEAGRVVPGLRDRQLGDDERVILHENVARVRATLDWIETAVDTGKVDVDGELAKLLQGE